MVRLMKLTSAQVSTLDVLRHQVCGWATSKAITWHGGFCASLPKLIELGLVERRESFDEKRGYSLTEWRAT